MTRPAARLVARLGAALLALLPIAAPAGESEDHLRVYGHVSPAVVSYDDGTGRTTRAADNAYSGGRIGLWLDLPVPGARTRFNAESSLGVRPSSALSQDRTPPLIDIDAATLRKLELIVDTARAGSFSFGQGSMASDSITQSDLSQTQLAAYVGLSDTAGGQLFRTAAGALSDIDIATAFPSFDGGRAPRLRWDSPALDLGGLGSLGMAAAAGVEVTDGRLVVNDSLADASLFYRNRIGDLEVKASAGAAIAEDDAGRVPQSAGSLSLLHAPSGISVTAAAGAREGRGDYVYAKLGLRRRWFAVGETGASLDLYRGSDTVAAGSRAQSWGIGLVQDLDRADLHLYLGIRRYRLDMQGATGYRPSTSVIFGTKWTFRRLAGLRLRGGRSERDWHETD